ncbi:MAG: hypothetical protein IPL00_15615 [Gammaproteobacteria bacterium]|nr:hypothetical protein [Gammaproteobacteria bacterium]
MAPDVDGHCLRGRDLPFDAVRFEQGDQTGVLGLKAEDSFLIRRCHQIHTPVFMDESDCDGGLIWVAERLFPDNSLISGDAPNGTRQLF